jgi:hypothetical protein
VTGDVTRGNFERKTSVTGSRRVKPWIPNRSKRKLMLGEDIGLEDTISLALCTLVGRFSYRARCKMPLEEWVSSTWCPLLGYMPEVVFMTKGWYGFHFKRAEDSAIILEKPWSYDGGSLMLKALAGELQPDQDYFFFRHFLGVITWLAIAFLECKGFGSHW